MNIHHELITPNLRTTSRVVAEKFGKQHKDVLKRIENITAEAPEEFSRRNFAPRDYLDSRGKHQPQFELTRDGFTLLAMGFTGAAAMEWKVRFIEAFNMMEAELAPKVKGADEPTRFGEDLTTREKLTAIRETRLLHGKVAGRRMWAMLDFPNVSDRPQAGGVLASPTEGRACLAYLLGLDAEGRIIGDWLADGQDSVALNRNGLRIRDDGLFISHQTPVFASSRWSGGRHRAALMALEGVFAPANPLTLRGRGQRGLVVLLSAIAGELHVN